MMDKKHRMTHQRQIILDYLGSVDTHPTADDVYKAVRKELPKISLGTVYRNLEVLSEIGEIRKLDHVGSQKRFDRDTSNHYHIRCTTCGNVEDIWYRPMNEIEETISNISEYEITGYHLEFEGICPDCKKKKTLEEEIKNQNPKGD